MKLEMGESAIYSWLRHVKKCQLAQMNWKISPEWDQVIPASSYQKLMCLAQERFESPFGNTQGISQLMKQAEIDVLGINYNNKVIYAVDIAFHEAGLNYGSKEKAIKSVTKKILRSIFAIKILFGEEYESEVYFVSPKVNTGMVEELELRFAGIREFIEENSIDSEIDIIYNSRFNDEIFIPLKRLSLNVSDTSELFLRSVQLVNQMEQ